ncbi:MAG: sigma-70 family RNA polymerase sigma factor [Anaerolineaceae bacterium]
MQADIHIDKLIQRDRKEYVALVDSYSDKIYRLALRMTGDEQDAEDVLQETFIKVFKNIDGFKGLSSLSTWIYRIAMNEALMLLRKRRPEGYSLDEENEDEDITPRQIASWDALPEKALVSSETAHHLQMAVMRLSDTLRSVFLLRDTEHFSVKETAEALGISEGAVKVRLLRARLKLREYLSEYFSEPGLEM